MKTGWFLFLSFVLVLPAAAHDGPPYPIFDDERVGGMLLSIWTDPDVGEGTFYYYLDPDRRGGAAQHDPADIRIEAVSQSKLNGETVRGFGQPAKARDPFQQIGTLTFSHQGAWSTRFLVRDASEQDALLAELEYELDVTPPGLGPIELTWFAIPFLALGAIWIRVLLAKRAITAAYDRRGETSPSQPPSPFET